MELAMFLNGSLNQPSSELALGSVKPDVVNPPRSGHLTNVPDPPEADMWGELTSFKDVRTGKRPPQEPQQARAEHVGDRGGGASRRPVSGCSRGARRDRGPAGPKETQGTGEARAAGKAPLITAAARKRGGRQYASAIVTRRAETLQGLGGAGRKREPRRSWGRGAGRGVERDPGRRSGDVIIALVEPLGKKFRLDAVYRREDFCLQD